MRTTTYKQYIEILPAAFLSQRRTWQPITRTLPAGSCLLITNPNNKEQTKFMQMLIQSFQEKGRRVVVWPLGQERKAIYLGYFSIKNQRLRFKQF